MDRRTFIAAGGLGAAAMATATAASLVDLALPGGPSLRPLLPRFPQKGEMIVQRIRPPLLETPFEVFDQETITPNDRFFVRWHWGDIPTSIDAAAYRLTIRGAVRSPLSLSLTELLRVGEHVEFAAVNQCAGNGRGLFEPRVAGAQWANGAMGNAVWRGVRLRDLLDRAGIARNAKIVRFKGLDKPLVDGAPHYMKSLPIDVARRDDTIAAFAMNGAAMPLLNGYPIRLVVPGWFSTYWVKMLSDIEVLPHEDDNFWMAKAYRMPTVPVKPGDKDFPTVPVSTMPPRAFVTGPDGRPFERGTGIDLRGIAMGGDCGVERVVALAGGRSYPATLEPELGKYGFRRWTVRLPALVGDVEVAVRATNTNGVAQPDVQSWNPSGYARDVVERVRLTMA